MTKIKTEMKSYKNYFLCVLIVLQSLLLLFSIIYVLLFIIFISFNLLFIFRMQINEWIKQKKKQLV